VKENAPGCAIQVIHQDITGAFLVVLFVGPAILLPGEFLKPGAQEYFEFPEGHLSPLAAGLEILNDLVRREWHVPSPGYGRPFELPTVT
jgi:hypothetical protein